MHKKRNGDADCGVARRAGRLFTVAQKLREDSMSSALRRTLRAAPSR